MSRAAVYLRQSLDRDGSGDAVARQRTACQKLCEARGWTVVAEYVDNSVSASKDRDAGTAFGRMLADASAGRFDVVVAFAADRLARRLSDIERLISTGVKAATVQGGLDLTTPEGEAQAGILATFARMEVRQKAERQRLAHAQRFDRGEPPGGARAFGWQRDGRTVVEAEAAAVRDAATAILTGGSLRAIARTWNAAGHRTARGNPWAPYAVRTLLLNPRTAGLRARQVGRDRWEVAGPGKWPALVPEQTWRAVCAVLSDPGRRTVVSTERVSLLSGIALCGAPGSDGDMCGRPVVTGGTRHGRRTYKCLPVLHLSRVVDPVDEHVVALIINRLSRPDAVDLLAADPANRPDLNALRVEGQALRARLDEAAAMYARGTVTGPQLERITAETQARLAEVEDAITDAGRLDVLAPLVTSDDVAGTWVALGLDAQRAVVSALVTVVLHPPGQGARVFRPESVTVTPRHP